MITNDHHQVFDDQEESVRLPDLFKMFTFDFFFFGDAPLMKSQDWHLLITADTIVLVDGEILEKPSDRVQASCMIQQLNGKTHSVLTAVVFYYDQQSMSVCVSPLH